MKHTILLTLLIIFGLTSCKNSSIQTKIELAKITQDTLSNLTLDKDDKRDTFHFDTVSYPNDSIFITKLLTTGIFHSDEVWESADKEKWYGLFKNQHGYYISETKLITKRVNDPIVDENDKTGWEVQTLNNDTSIILIQGLNYLSNHKIQQIALSKHQVFPGDTLELNYLGTIYKIFSTGEKKKVHNNSDWFEIRNYKLYLTANKNGKVITELLVAQPNFDDNMIKIIFMGDIDNDGFLDLIIDTSRHYNVKRPTLYLSKSADNTHLLKVIGGHKSVGC